MLPRCPGSMAAALQNVRINCFALTLYVALRKTAKTRLSHRRLDLIERNSESTPCSAKDAFTI